jgi:inosine/xanthosine triphosphate pyrophosphatase family protein
MAKVLLMATTNSHKKERFKQYFDKLELSVVSFADLGLNIEVEEDGETPEENALKKAKAGYDKSGISTFGVDYWFYIEGIPDELQPGPFVRRIFKEGGMKRKEATDEEMLDYYTRLIDRIGGKTKGLWVSAISLVTISNNFYTESFTRETILTSEKSTAITAGEPLNSIQIDPVSGKYFSELAKGDWLKLQNERESGYANFIYKHIDEI